MANHSHLGKFLKEKRMEAGFSQAEIASFLKDVHPQFISNWERGLCTPPGHCFKSLIKLLRIQKEELLEVMLVDSRASLESRIFGKSEASQPKKKINKASK